ncbi:hypothetical protein MFLAVUS_011495 [Mucor flavus]|uniref:Chromo domain-containing protein n=1 Tax=Mucor flavus TaxID=439312 RepID=A0ABP9ZFL9_9FUNG
MDARIRLQKEYEKLISSNWTFLDNDYTHVEKKHYHRTELQEIKLIDQMKDEVFKKLGELPINPELVKHVTLILDGHHNRIVYENVTVDQKILYSWKLKAPELEESNFTFPINKQKKIKLQDDEDKLNKYVAGFDAKNNIRVTKLETYNIQLILCCVLLNLKKISDMTNLTMIPKYSKWMEKGFNYPDINNITCKTKTVIFKINSMKLMKQRQLDTLSMLLSDIDIVEDSETIGADMIIDSTKNTYEIQYIYQHRKDSDGKKEYLVKWKGYNKKYNTWVKEDDFIENDILIEYNKDIMEEDL